ncbi:MAG TPA: response regulator transcription factor [Bacteriovoracaceae bacterium]|nr:response regulator transcription factor [Bacteriovoracaceae bacterium]
MNKRVVIVEDEKEIIESLKYMIEKHDFEVIGHESAESLFTDFQNKFCVYLIDWNLPGIKGVDIVRTIRTKDKISPVFMISANSSPEHILEGLKSGADDYLVKPFSYDALMIKLMNAYSKVSTLHENLINVGLKLIPEANSVIKDGVTVNLTAREFIIFQYLYNRPGVASTREELINQFDKDFDMTARNIDVHVFSLRKKMNKVSISIETVWGTGYKLSL